MSERLQRTAASMREKMLQRYGDGHHHKHDRTHNRYRTGCRSHPVKSHYPGTHDGADSHASTGLVREFKLKKYRRVIARYTLH